MAHCRGRTKTYQNLNRVAVVKIRIDILFTAVAIFFFIFSLKNFAHLYTATKSTGLLFISRPKRNDFRFAERIGLLRRCVNRTPNPVLKSQPSERIRYSVNGALVLTFLPYGGLNYMMFLWNGMWIGRMREKIVIAIAFYGFFNRLRISQDFMFLSPDCTSYISSYA